MELGAVTPYYWPNRISRIVDPCDSHPLTTDRLSLFDVDFGGRDIVSISTIEHVGTSQYGLSEASVDRNAVAALDKIIGESSFCVITVPVGWNRLLDEHILDVSTRSRGANFWFLRRCGSYRWTQVDGAEAAAVEYGNPDYANAIAVIEKGSLLCRRN